MSAGAALMHLLFSTMVSGWISETTDHRLFNVRNIDDRTQWDPLIRLFVEDKLLNDPRPKILMLGSSVTWGYSWPDEDIFSWHLQNHLPYYQVINGSIIGFSLNGILDLSCVLSSLESNIYLTILEINAFNVQAPDQPERTECRPVDEYVALGGNLNYLHYTFANPWGLNYFRIFWNQYDYYQDERVYAPSDLPESYFPNALDLIASADRLANLIRWSLDDARSMSEHTALFIAPTLREGLESANYDVDNFERLTDLIVSLCSDNQGTVCLDPGLDMPREYFGNVTHLNKRGHEYFASWLLSNLHILNLAAPAHARAAQN